MEHLNTQRRRTRNGLSLLPTLLLLGGQAANADQNVSKLTLQGTLIEQEDISKNISGIAVKGDTLVVGSDEGADVLVLTRDAAAVADYVEQAQPCISLDGQSCGSARDGTEVDIEGLAWGDKYLYVIGSHSQARKSVKAPETGLSKKKLKKLEKKNLERITQVKIEPTREQLFRVELDPNGVAPGGSKTKVVTLRKLFANHPVLARFQTIPSKENGIDIEGLAVKSVGGEDQLYLGFRGPVLRGNHALVMVLKFDKGKFKTKKIEQNPRIHYLNLGGRGIRGITETADGFLVLAGPVGDAENDDPNTRYQVYSWDGSSDDLLGAARQPLCNVPVSPGNKAEGIALLKDKSPSGSYRLMAVFDGAAKGEATEFDCGPNTRAPATGCLQTATDAPYPETAFR